MASLKSVVCFQNHPFTNGQIKIHLPSKSFKSLRRFGTSPNKVYVKLHSHLHQICTNSCMTLTVKLHNIYIYTFFPPQNLSLAPLHVIFMNFMQSSDLLASNTRRRTAQSGCESLLAGLLSKVCCRTKMKKKHNTVYK